jgi:hypothetical protein
VNGRKRLVLPALLFLGCATALLNAVAAPAAQSDPPVKEVLRRERFVDADFRALGAGGAVVKSLDTPVRQELAVFGAVHVDTPAAHFLDRFGDIERFEKGPGIPQIGRLSQPPRLEDLAALTLPARDVAALAECRPGDCDLKLSTAAMTRFRNQIDWSSANASGRAHTFMREMIVELVRAYQANGNVALGRYDDTSEPVEVGAQFRALLANSTQLPVAVPELITYLAQYPRGRPVGADDFFYWSVVDFGLKPTVRVNHVVVYPLAAKPSGISHVIAIKQLYATHYFHTALELRFLAADGRANQQGFYLLSLIRSRSDGTTGLKGSLLRPIIARRSRNAVRGYLEYLKRQVERPVPAPSEPSLSAVSDQLRLISPVSGVGAR